MSNTCSSWCYTDVEAVICEGKSQVTASLMGESRSECLLGPGPQTPTPRLRPGLRQNAPVDITTGNLRDLARVIVEHLHTNGFPAEGGANRQVLALAEECGEFVGAYRRWSGQARRGGTAEEMHAELADVVITAFATAEELGIDLDKVITEKANVVLTRGWREQASPR